MYIVLDLEFYHNNKRAQLGPIKQLGAFKFNDDYKVVDIFEMTVTQYTRQDILKQLFAHFASDVETLYLWAKDNDLKALNEALGISEENYEIIDVQNYFKDVHLGSLSAISEALSFEPEGRHNALVDAEYTFEVIKHFQLNNTISRNAIENYVNLIRSNEVNKINKKSVAQQSKKLKKRVEYKLITPGSMRKLNDEYYQIVSERAINSIIEEIIKNKYSICTEGNITLEKAINNLVIDDADIIISNTPKFKSIAKKYEDKLIIITDNERPSNYLAIFVSKKAYKKFIK